MLFDEILSKKKNSRKLAIKCGYNEITYEQLYQKSKKLSALIDDIDLSAKNIGIFLPNSIEYTIAYFSILSSNRAIVPISILTKKAEMASTIDYCEIQLIITNTMYKEILIDYFQDDINKVVILNIDDSSTSITKYNLTCTLQKEVMLKSKNENDVALLLHTSGTTSYPKRVMLTHKNLLSNIKSNIESLQLKSNDKVLIALPMHFGYCNTAQLLTHLYLEATIVIMEGMFAPKTFFKLIQQEQITNFTGVPTMLLMLLNYRYKNKYDISSLRYICFGGGNIPKEKVVELIKTFPTVGFVQTYGQTEASPRVTALLPLDSLSKCGSVGKAIPNVNVRIVDKNNRDVKAGEVGQIIVYGDNVMKGYYKRKEETDRVIRGGWLYTGDLAKYDEYGYIYIMGRIKNIIISGGLNIYPEEIEELMMCHLAVKEVCVLGESHELLGEVPVAKVVLNENAGNINARILKNFCFENLAEYKVPYKIDFLNELPKTFTGKVKRF